MIRKLDWSKENIFAYEASETMTKEENQQVFDELKRAIAQYGKVRIFVRLPEMAYPALDSIIDRLRFAFEYMNKIERYALVSNIRAADWIGRIAGLFAKTEFRTYSLDDELLARSWLELKHA